MKVLVILFLIALTIVIFRKAKEWKHYQKVAEEKMTQYSKSSGSISDQVIKNCPHCHHKGSIRDFGTWEKDGKRGLLGKTPEGHIIFLCPECNEEIKFDPLLDQFLKNK